MRINYAILDESENLKQCSYLKCSYLKMGIHGNALAVSFFRRHARLRSRGHDFHYSIEKRCGKLRRYVSFNEIWLIIIEALKIHKAIFLSLSFHELRTASKKVDCYYFRFICS